MQAGEGVEVGDGAVHAHVEGLTADHALVSGGQGQLCDQGGAQGRGQRRKDGERLGLEGVAHQDGGVLSVDAVDGGAAPALVVVVHGRQVVVDQRVAVDQLDGGCGVQGRVGDRLAQRLVGGQGQQGTDALAAGLQRVAAGLAQAGGGDIGEAAQEEGVHPGAEGTGPGGQCGGVAHGVASSLGVQARKSPGSFSSAMPTFSAPASRTVSISRTT